MTHLLLTVILVQKSLILILLFKSPFRKLVILGMDTVKQGRGPAIAKAIAGTLFVFFVSTLYNIMKIKKRSLEFGAVLPTDQVLISNFRLDASYMGFCLFLAFMIDRLHYYIRELWLLRKSLKMAEKQIQECKDGKIQHEKEITNLEDEISELRSTISQMELELRDTNKEVNPIKATKRKGACLD